ncbi:MAG: glycosyltransferase family 39 protein, partial [Anaerolineales bacterium]|nr:glycosyltransferase family 39 protein [Anaerolineales bacterium]
MSSFKLNLTDRQRETTILIVLFLIGLLSRGLFASRILYHWDSVNFAFALEEFDVSKAQPHIPGYIIYVIFMRGVNIFFGDPQASMVGVSILASALAIVQLYRVGKMMFGRRTGIWAALFLASSPLYWFYGEIALPHALDALLILISIELLFQIDKGDAQIVIFTAIWLGLVGGFRPQTEVFLMPLVLYACRKIGWTSRIYAILALVITNLIWLIPLLLATGGLQAYWNVFRHFYSSFNTTTSIISGGGLLGILRNLRKLSMYTLYGWGFASLILIPAVVKIARSLLKTKSLHLDECWRFLGLWIVPSLLYYTFIHMGQQGLVFVYLPALLLITARALVNLDLTKAAVRLALPGVLILGSSLIFLAGPAYPLGTDRLKLLTVDTIREHDRYYLDRIEAVRNQFDPKTTILVASEWRFLQYYLPEYVYQPYEIYARGEDRAGQPISTSSTTVLCPSDEDRTAAEGVCPIVLFDKVLDPWVTDAERIGRLSMQAGSEMLYLNL